MTKEQETEIKALRDQLKAMSLMLEQLAGQADMHRQLYREAAEHCSECRMKKKCKGECGVKS